MQAKLTRRQTLQMAAAGTLGGLLAACAPAPAVPVISPAQSDSPEAKVAAVSAEAVQSDRLVAGMTSAAIQFLSALDANKRSKASYVFADAERQRWHWTTPGNFPRNGLPLNEMSEAQQTLALALLRASVSEIGYQKALDIMSLQVDLGNDPKLYFVTVFGEPGAADGWGWRWEGHHISRQFTLKGEQIAVTPFFLGAWPTQNNAGLRAMPREEDAARELILSLNDNERRSAIFQQETLTRHVTQNQPYVTPLDLVGIAAGSLSAEQQTLILEIIQTYLSVLPVSIATPHFARIEAAGLDKIQFGWAGSLEPRQPHYYRLQGPTFLLEFDNSRNRGAHIHSVWRDFAEDFGQGFS